jgi:hypothetical protein
MSEGTCDVSIGGYDGDPAEVFHASIVTAQGSQCDSGEHIAPKQQYERISGKWDGSWSVWFCPRAERSALNFPDGRTFGMLWEDLEANWDEGAHLQACLNRLTTVAAKERMRHQWMKWKQL